jgi:D-proline reductase (dithiol) PrdB
MVRIADVPAVTRANIEALDCPTNDNQPWVSAVPLAERKIVLISSAGLMLRGEPTVGRSEAGYRAIPHNIPAGDILMSHVSINYDRTGFQQDLNTILPRDRLDELADTGKIGAVADTHYSFMGATDPRNMETHARELAARLLADGVAAAVLLPV